MFFFFCWTFPLNIENSFSTNHIQWDQFSDQNGTIWFICWSPLPWVSKRSKKSRSLKWRGISYLSAAFLGILHTSIKRPQIFFISQKLVHSVTYVFLSTEPHLLGAFNRVLLHLVITACTICWEWNIMTQYILLLGIWYRYSSFL